MVSYNIHLQTSLHHHHLSIRVYLYEYEFFDVGVRWATPPIKKLEIILQQQLTNHHLHLIPGQPLARTVEPAPKWRWLLSVEENWCCWLSPGCWRNL